MRTSPRKRFRDSDSNLDISSLLDIIFILLIFVMVSVSFTKVYRQMEMDLPSASKSASANGDSSISVSLFEDGKIYLDNKNIKIEELKSESEKKIFKDKVVSLAVEKKVPFEKFVEIADIIKLGGALKTEITVK